MNNGTAPRGTVTTISAVSVHCSHNPEANWKKYCELID